MFGIPLNQIASFTIDHTNLQPGLYLSRQDGQINTYDLRFKRPNKGDYLSPGTAHSIEHLAATYLRNHPDFGNKIIYFGPMGCRTGFYLLLADDYNSKDIVPLMISLFEFIRDFNEEVPGASAKDCGNYLDMNLPMANYIAKKYLDTVLYSITDTQLIYPE